MKTFDLLDLTLKDALISPCRRYSLLSYMEIKTTEAYAHFGKDALVGTKIAKFWDHEKKACVDIIVKENENKEEFISINKKVRYIKDFKHPSGRDIMSRIAQSIHEFAYNNRCRRDKIEVVCGRFAFETLRIELLSQLPYCPDYTPGVIQFYGCRVRVADDLPYDYLITEIWTSESPLQPNKCKDHITDSLKHKHCHHI